MRLKVKQTIVGDSPSPIISTWFSGDSYITVSDDKSIRSINQSNNQTIDQSVLSTLDFYPTAVGRSNTQSVSSSANQDQIAIGGSDGGIRFMSQSINQSINQRVDRVVNGAHHGAVTSLVWSLDGSQLVSAGEDGTIKLWSKAGNLRSKLVDYGSQSQNASITGLQWLTNNATQSSTLLYACGDTVYFHPLVNQANNASSQSLKWRAHSGSVTCFSYHPTYRLLVTGGSDRVYRVWDEFGHLLYSSNPLINEITSVSWSRRGDVFAVGSFDCLLLVARQGWVHERVRINSGSISHIAWAADGRCFIVAGMNGTLHTCTLVKRSIECGHLEVELTEHNSLILRDLTQSADSRLDEFDFTCPMLDFALSSTNLLVVTTESVHIYNAPSFTSPIVLPLKITPRVVHLSKNCFSLMDSRSLNLYTMSGKSLPTPRLPSNIDFDALHADNTCLSNELFVFTFGPSAYFIEIDTGKMLCDPLIHSTDILSVRLTQTQSMNQTHLLLLDRQKDCYIISIEHLLNNQAHNQTNNQSNTQSVSHSIKLAGQVTAMRWHNDCSMCLLISEQNLLCHACPSMSFVDRELASLACSSIETSGLGSHGELVSFESSRCVVRRSDGTLQSYSLPISATFLHRSFDRGEWASCVACCRVMNDLRAWAMLAALSISHGQLDIAEQCLAACDEVTKLRKIQFIKQIPSTVGRQAWLLAYQHQFDAAEQLLLTHGMHYRAIQLALERCRWIRAINLATQFSTHIDTVLQARRQWLQLTGKDEIEPVFMQLGDVQVDAQQIANKIKQEIEKEQSKHQEYVSQLPV